MLLSSCIRSSLQICLQICLQIRPLLNQTKKTQLYWFWKTIFDFSTSSNCAQTHFTHRSCNPTSQPRFGRLNYVNAGDLYATERRAIWVQTNQRFRFIAPHLMIGGSINGTGSRAFFDFLIN